MKEFCRFATEAATKIIEENCENYTGYGASSFGAAGGGVYSTAGFGVNRYGGLLGGSREYRFFDALDTYDYCEYAEPTELAQQQSVKRAMSRAYKEYIG